MINSFRRRRVSRRNLIEHMADLSRQLEQLNNTGSEIARTVAAQMTKQQPIVLKADGREIARAVGNEQFREQFRASRRS